MWTRYERLISDLFPFDTCHKTKIANFISLSLVVQERNKRNCKGSDIFRMWQPALKSQMLIKAFLRHLFNGTWAIDCSWYPETMFGHVSLPYKEKLEYNSFSTPVRSPSIGRHDVQCFQTVRKTRPTWFDPCLLKWVPSQVSSSCSAHWLCRFVVLYLRLFTWLNTRFMYIQIFALVALNLLTFFHNIALTLIPWLITFTTGQAENTNLVIREIRVVERSLSHRNRSYCRLLPDFPRELSRRHICL